MLAKDLTEKEYIYGHKACPGCALGIVARLSLKVFGERTVVAVPACCMSATTFMYPQISYHVPAMTLAFPSTGATLSGVAAGFKAQGVDDVTVVGFAGDGGTADIGLQALSGAIEQGQNFIYICYDNEAYMNTGIQRSSATPVGATTTTTPAGPCSTGERTAKKNLFEIAMAHRIPYAATASVSYPNDLVRKLEKAKNVKGPAFLHVFAPCCTGWGFDSALTVEIGKMAQKCGLWYLAEYENEKVTVNQVAKDPEPIEPYLMAQRRFKHLKAPEIEAITAWRDKELQKVYAWME